jgi:uncharacterized protein (TIGR04141 family)
MASKNPSKKKVAPGPSTVTLTMRLMLPGQSVEDSLRDADALTEQTTTVGRLFTDQSNANRPTWLGFINGFVEGDPLVLENRSCSAILFLNVQVPGSTDERTFTLTFGSGHHALRQEAFERNFGLKVTLNAVARQDLKNLDVATPEATTLQKRIQSSRKMDLQGFGIDVERDLLRLAGGIPTDTGFARSLAGRDALTLSAKMTPADLEAKCLRALKLYEATDYKKDYGFIDQIAPVRDQPLVEALDDLVFAEVQELLAGHASDLHLTLPEIIDPERSHEIGYFGLGFRSGTKPGFGEIAIEDYIAELAKGHPDQLTSMAELKSSHEVRVVIDGQGNKERKRRIYDCFVFETTHDQKTYVLFAGDWYLVEDKFFKSVEQEFNRLLSATPIRATTTALNEQELIAELDLDPDLLNLDKVKCSPFGALGANLEPCDFLSRSKAFIHLKDGHGSDAISHLWNQGVVSAETFVRDDVFRKSMRKSAMKRQAKAGKAGFEALLPDGRSKPVPTDYKVIFGIMRHRYKRTNRMGLPFFSMVSLRVVANRIELMGYGVEVHLIEKV